MMNISTHGISAKTWRWIGSVACGLSRICSHIVRPSRIGRMPTAISDGGWKGRNPNRLTGVSGSGAERSRIHKAKGWWRISTASSSTL